MLWEMVTFAYFGLLPVINMDCKWRLQCVDHLINNVLLLNIFFQNFHENLHEPGDMLLLKETYQQCCIKIAES
jgi:hypothetical protein